MSLQRTFSKMEGAVVDNRYRLAQLLGTGGFGGVFRSQEFFMRELLREVAVKLIAPPDIENFEGLSLKEREVQFQKQRGQQWQELAAAVNMSHPHIIGGFHVGAWQWQGEDYLYLVMELAKGTLQAYTQDRCLNETEIRKVLLDAARGLDYLHREKQQVHRDLKPGNILYSDGQWKLSDFGLVKQLSQKTQTRTMTVAGSLVYMPPEAFAAEGSQVSPGWDLWSLGILGAVLVDQGELPYDYQSEMQLMYKIAQGEVTLPTTAPDSLVPLLRNLLQKDRRQRWSAQQVIHYLERRPTTVAAPVTPQVSGNATNRIFVETLPGGVPLELVPIPAGSFLMGSPDSDREGSDGSLGITPSSV